MKLKNQQDTVQDFKASVNCGVTRVQAAGDAQATGAAVVAAYKAREDVKLLQVSPRCAALLWSTHQRS